MMAAENKQSFWEHLDVLRAAIGKIALVTVGFGMVAFFFKEMCIRDRLGSLAVYGNRAENSREEVEKWLKQIGIIE